MVTSAGLAIIMQNKILMCHPTGSRWYGTYSIPKGMVDEGESILDAAIRETKEEVGIIVKPFQINKGVYRIDYPESRYGKKELYFYIVEVDDPSNIGMDGEVIDKSKFKPNKEGVVEIDWAGFITFSEARKRASRPMQKVLDIVESIDSSVNFVISSFKEFLLEDKKERFYSEMDKDVVASVSKEDKNLEDIRFFRGNLEQFKELIKKKIEETKK